MDESTYVGARIVVVGVGGGGTNAVNNMIKAGVEGCEFIAMNTDRQALIASSAKKQIQLGRELTRGLGAGADPEIGKKAAEESRDEIREAIEGADLLFIAAGMGGGTGTGAAPVVAEIAKSLGILSIAVVTKPFEFEGKPRMRHALEGIEQLRKHVDTLLVIPNQKLIGNRDIQTRYGDEGKKIFVFDSFKIADDVLRQGIQGITDIIVKPGLINLDFADVRAVIKNKGIAHMGIGVGHGDKGLYEAANNAVSSSLLETRIEGATAIILNFSGGKLSLEDIGEVIKLIEEIIDPDAKIIFGLYPDEKMGDEIRLTVIATGFQPIDNSLILKRKAQASQGRRMYESGYGNPAGGYGAAPNGSFGNPAANPVADRPSVDPLSQPLPPSPIIPEPKESGKSGYGSDNSESGYGSDSRGGSDNRGSSYGGSNPQPPKTNYDDRRSSGGVKTSRIDVSDRDVPPFLRRLRK